MQLSTEQKLEIYRRSLREYEASGDPKAEVQKRLIARLEEELRLEKLEDERCKTKSRTKRKRGR